jgi:hypothetical protein
MTKSVAKAVLSRTNGKFFTVTFEKKDGTVRTLNGRLSVKAHLHGGSRTTNPDDYAVVYDVHAKGYRAVAYDRVKEIRHKKVYR